MSTLYLRGKTWYVGVPTRGGWCKRTTGTRDKALARAMANMVDAMGRRGKREWFFLEAVASEALAVGALHDAYSVGDLDGLRDRMHDVDLDPRVTQWLDTIRSQVAKDTAEHYGLYVRSLIVEGRRFPRSDLTRERLTHWLASREVGRSTKRKYHAAMSSY